MGVGIQLAERSAGDLIRRGARRAGSREPSRSSGGASSTAAGTRARSEPSSRRGASPAKPQREVPGEPVPGGVKSPGGGGGSSGLAGTGSGRSTELVFSTHVIPAAWRARLPRGAAPSAPAPHPELAAVSGLAAARGVVTPRARCLVLREMPPWVGHAGTVCLGLSFPRLLGTSLLLNEIFPFLATSRARAGLRAPHGAADGGPGTGPGCSVPAPCCRAASYGAALCFPCSATGKGAGEAACGRDVLGDPVRGAGGGRGAADASFGLRFGYWASAAPTLPSPAVPCGTGGAASARRMLRVKNGI